MNPFHIWLGLPEKSVNPNHYQLLGLKSSERDSNAIEKAAKTRLAQLKKVAPTSGQAAAFEKIKQRILKAHSILTDPAARAEYDKKLKSQLEAVRKQKQSAPSMAAEPPASSLECLPHESTTGLAPKPVPTTLPVAASHSPAAPMQEQHPAPTADNQSPPSPPQIIDTSPNASVQPVSPPAHPDIPMAVPIPAQGAAKTNPVAPTSNDAAFTDFSLTNNDPASAGVAVKSAKYRRKKRSYFVPILGLILCIMGIIALVYVVLNLEDFTNVTSPDVAASTARNVEEPNGGELSENPDKDDSTLVVTPPGNGESEESPTELGGSASKPAPAKPGSGIAKSNVKYVSLEFDELIQFRRHMENARRAMYRRDAQTAQNEIENAKSLFKKFESNKKIQLDPKQKEIQKAAYSAGNIKSLLEGFWQQVVSSAANISSGQEIRVANRAIGFVEGSEQYVVLRIDGANITYNYEFLPPGIAMALADQGAKEDVPTWRMQKAAFYAAHSHIDAKYKDRAIEFAKEAEKDNHDPTPIINYINFDPETVGVPDSKTEELDSSILRELTPKARVRLGVDDLRRLRPDQAEGALGSVLDAAVTEKNATNRVVSFEIAYRLAVKTGDIRRVIDVLDEFRLWVEIDYDMRLNSGLISVGKEKLDERRARFLLRQMIASAKTISDQRLKNKIINSGKKIADEFGLTSLGKRLEGS